MLLRGLWSAKKSSKVFLGYRSSSGLTGCGYARAKASDQRHGPVWVKICGPSWVQLLDHYRPKTDRQRQAAGVGPEDAAGDAGSTSKRGQSCAQDKEQERGGGR